MAIRIIKKGTIECDICKEKLAEIQLSEQLLKIFIDEQRFIKIECLNCYKEVV